MSRWHENGCKQPQVTSLDSTLCCTHCFAFADVSPSQENILFDTTSSSTRSGQHEHDSKPSVHRLHSSTVLFSKIRADEQFRLLRIKAGIGSTAIHILVETDDVRSPTHSIYDILSYARIRHVSDHVEWRMIYLGKYWDVLFIPRQYEQVLQDVRHETTDQIVWMECLCVDAMDMEERKCQTTLAPQIIRGASKILICLASDLSEEYESALLFLNSLIHTESGPPKSLCSRNLARLKELMRHDYFSTVQVIREVVLGKKSMVVYRGLSFLWTAELFDIFASFVSAPQWLRGPTYRYSYTAKDILDLLLEVVSYHCHDHRDKIFVVLALFHIDNVSVDYEISVAKIFTDVAAYLIRNGLLNEVLLITTSQERPNQLPSWVPDWSVAVEVSSKLTPRIQKKRDDMDLDDEDWDEAIPVEFLFQSTLHSDILIDVVDNQLIIPDCIRLCTIGDALIETHAKMTTLRIDREAVGTIVITCPHGSYTPEHDSLFVSNSMNTPVILRHDPRQNTYAFICTCTVSRGPPTTQGELFIPWQDPTLDMDVIRVLAFSQDEVELMQEFDNELREIPSRQLGVGQEVSQSTIMPPSHPELLVLDLALLSLTGLFEVEIALSKQWKKLDQEIGWLFLDRQALSLLLSDINRGSEELRSGHGALSFADDYFASCGLDVPLHYDWDVSTFCRSFATRSTAAPTGIDHQNPALVLLQSQLARIREWAAITAQLFVIFDYSGICLAQGWPNFPGVSLAKRWHTLSFGVEEEERSWPESESCEWDWSEFRNVLQMRLEIWSQSPPQELRLATNKKLATRLSLRCLGLNLSVTEEVRIE